MNGDIPQPYDVSARYSDYVYEQCFGTTGRSLNQRVLQVVNKLVPKPGRILELGAGTGRLTIPLAQAGHTVTALDQSAGMVASLKEKLAAQPLDLRERVSVGRARLQHYRSREPRYNLVLCIFTVLNHLRDSTNLRAFAKITFQRLEPGGFLLLGLATEPALAPGQVLNRGAFNLSGLRRKLDLEVQQNDLYRRIDFCEGTFQGERFRYRDFFDWRIWRPGELREILVRAGFEVDWDAGVDMSDLARIDADCFLFRKPDPRLDVENEEGLVKDVVSDGGQAAPEGCQAITAIQPPSATLPEISLKALIDLMRATGFWLNPNLRPDQPDFRRDFTKFLPHLARCRMLVQCNPNKPMQEVHDWMTRIAEWREFESARVLEVHYVPVIGDREAYQNRKQPVLEPSLRFVFEAMGKSVELRADQCWLRYYLVSFSLDAQHERLLRVVHLGCRPLTAFAVFFAPNSLRPEGIAKPPWPWRP